MESGRRPVSEVMQTEYVGLKATDTLDYVEDVMALGRIRHLPVLDGERIVGVVSQRDLLAAALSRTLESDSTERRSHLRRVAVADVMSRSLVTASPETTCAEAARTLVRRKIGCVPVVDADGRLLGLVTETDLLRAAYGEGGG